MAKVKRRKCSKCGRVGHNKATCKNKKKTTRKKAKKKIIRKKTKKKAKKKTTRRKTTTRSTGRRTLVGGGKGWRLFHFSGRTAKGNVSNKTWGIKKSGKKVWTHHGKTWGIKKSTPKTFKTAAAATSFYERKVNEKRNKGYVLVGRNRRRARQRRRGRK